MTYHKNDLYYKFLKIANDISLKEEIIIESALVYLYNKGYITKEELQDRKSERLNNIRMKHIREYECAVILLFDNNEWMIQAYVNKDLNVSSEIQIFDIANDKEIE